MSQAIWDTTIVQWAAQSGDYGAILRAVRRANNLTLADLARRCRYSASTLSRWETGKQPLRDTQVLRRLAAVLQIPPQLFGLVDTPPRAPRSPHCGDIVVGVGCAPDKETDPMHRRTLVTGLAGAAFLGTSMATHSAMTGPLHQLEQALLLPSADGAPVSVPALRRELACAQAHFDHGRYSSTAALLPALLADAANTRAEYHYGQSAAVDGMLAEANILASRLMVKLGRDHLAWITADRAMHAAHTSADLLVQAAAHRAWSIVLRRAGHNDTSKNLIIDTAATLQPELHRGPHYLAAYGSLLSTAAYTAAVDSDRDTADTLIREANDAATRLAHLNSPNTAFGAASVGLYQVSMARVLGDFGTAIDIARRINPAAIPSPERRARYWTDIARAYHHWGKPEHCYRALLAAEKASPDEVHYRKPIQDITTHLLRSRSATALPGIRDFAHRAGTPPIAP